MKLFKFKDLEITPIQNWDKPYNEIVVPRGFRLIKVEELWALLDSDKRDEFLGNYKVRYNYFWCAQTKYAKKNNYSVMLCLNGGSELYASVVWLSYSNFDGRVVFVKKEKRVLFTKLNKKVKK